ncbi:hypothetical protein FJ251_15010 [bacterium]|nr:hypothetical protein [bacterium]
MIDVHSTSILAPVMSTPIPLDPIEPAVHDAGAADLDALIAAELPASPIADFDALVASLAQELDEAREVRSARESERMQQAERLVGALEEAIEEVEEQLRRLEPLLAEFAGLGNLGSAGHRRILGAFESLRTHRDALAARLDSPALLEARQRRQERARLLQSELQLRLRPEASREVIEASLNEILSLDMTAMAWAEELWMKFSAEARAAGRTEHLPAVTRFWKQVARRLETGDPESGGRVRDRAIQLEREVLERDRHAIVQRDATGLVKEIAAGIRGLSHLGTREQIVQLSIWLGKLRKLQDEHSLDEALDREIYLTFGCVNAARKDLHLDHYFDALNRNFTTDWDAYLEKWKEKLSEARDEDLREKVSRAEAAQQQRDRELKAEAARQHREDVLRRVIEELAELRDDASWMNEPGQQEYLRETILAGVDADGNQSAEFITAVKPFAALVAMGRDFRNLRRALERAGVDFKAVQAITPPEEPRIADELAAKLKARWQGKILAVIGGLRKEETRVGLEESLALSEARWYEFYRGRGESEAAAAAIRAGGIDVVLLLIRFAGHNINDFRDLCDAAGIPCRTVTTGGGLTSLLRALDQG